MNSQSSPDINLAQFDEAFFAQYEQQLADISFEEQASVALADILTIKTDSSTEKTYEQIRDASRVFFSNEWVQRDEALMNQLAGQFAMACLGHNHGSELARDDSLSSVFERGVKVSGLGQSDDADHAHGAESAHESEAGTSDEEAASKKKKKGRRLRRGWLSWFEAR